MGLRLHSHPGDSLVLHFHSVNNLIKGLSGRAILSESFAHHYSLYGCLTLRLSAIFPHPHFNVEPSPLDSPKCRQFYLCSPNATRFCPLGNIGRIT